MILEGTALAWSSRGMDAFENSALLAGDTSHLGHKKWWSIWKPAEYFFFEGGGGQTADCIWEGNYLKCPHEDRVRCIGHISVAAAASGVTGSVSS